MLEDIAIPFSGLKPGDAVPAMSPWSSQCNSVRNDPAFLVRLLAVLCFVSFLPIDLASPPLRAFSDAKGHAVVFCTARRCSLFSLKQQRNSANQVLLGPTR